MTEQERMRDVGKALRKPGLVVPSAFPLPDTLQPVGSRAGPGQETEVRKSPPFSQSPFCQLPHSRTYSHMLSCHRVP